MSVRSLKAPLLGRKADNPPLYPRIRSRRWRERRNARAVWSTRSFTYDSYGNRISEKRTIAGIVYTTGYGYDLAGGLERITYPSGLIVTYARDPLGQVAQVSVQPGSAAPVKVIASSVAWMPFGPAQGLTLGNGVQVANSFDFDYRLTGTQASLGSAPLQSLSLTYDPASNVETIADAVTPGLSQSFQYNLGGHVTRGTGVYGTDNYTYDAMGNRLTRSLVKTTAASTTYAYTAANTRLLSAATGGTTLTYTYDAIGSVTARKVGNTTQAAYFVRLAVSSVAGVAAKYVFGISFWLGFLLALLSS
jgi:YD repeat-containing protein